MVGEGEEATAEGGGGDGGEASPSQAQSATMEVEAESRAVVLGRRVMANKQVLSIEEGRKERAVPRSGAWMLQWGV